jgi:hypothetical protein
MSGELADEVEQHLQWLRALRNALLLPHVDDRRQRHTAASLDQAIHVAECLRERLTADVAEPGLPR